VKTITLDEVAYARLKSWKKGTKESFSQVIKRVVPEPGTLGAFMSFVEHHATASLSQNEQMEAAIERPSVKHDPWI
jgi:predicted CopG family antitoxin